jgi:hypothetical protein
MPIVKKGEYGKYNKDIPTDKEGEDEEMIQMYYDKQSKGMFIMDLFKVCL